MYRIGFPLWRWFARLGVPLKLRIDVLRDAEAGVFVATSGDLPGLVCEAATMDELVTEVNSAVASLLELQFHPATPVRPITTDLRLQAA